ncbi:hypothetical protein ACFL6T_02955 [Candidatus Zixiibacteriota bacterium]
MPIQTVELDFPHGQVAPDIFCPACGTRILSADIEIEQPACPHVQYIWVEDEYVFAYLSEVLQAFLEADDSPEILDEEDLDEYPGELEVFTEARNNNTALDLQITVSGVSHVPVSYTTVLGLDLASSEPQ